MRERLIQLISNADEECKHSKDCKSCSGYGKGSRCMNYHIADYLIDKGVVLLPCKVGDKVFRATQLVNGESFVQEGIVFEIASTYENEKSKTRFYFWAKGDEWGSRHYSLWCDLTEFGKTVFLTREEAEAKLKGGATE